MKASTKILIVNTLTFIIALAIAMYSTSSYAINAYDCYDEDAITSEMMDIAQDKGLDFVELETCEEVSDMLMEVLDGKSI